MHRNLLLPLSVLTRNLTDGDSTFLKNIGTYIPDYTVLVFHMTVMLVGASWKVVAHAQQPDFVFRRNGRVHWNRRGHQFSRPLAAEVCASAVVMLDTSCSEVVWRVWRVLATHSICQFPLHFPSHASLCAITFQLESTYIQKFTVLVSHMIVIIPPMWWIFVKVQKPCLFFLPKFTLFLIFSVMWVVCSKKVSLAVCHLPWPK